MSVQKRTRWWVSLGTLLCVLVAAFVWNNSRPRQIFLNALDAIRRNELSGIQSDIEYLDARPGYEQFANCLKGAVLLRRGRYPEALRWFSRTRPEGEIRPTLLLLTGECLYRIGRLVEAERTLAQLVSEHPQDAEAHLWLGTVYHDLGAMPGAISELEAAIRINSDDWRPHALLASIYFDVEQYTEAVPHYRHVVAHKTDPQAEQALAISLYRLQRYREALEVLGHQPATADSLVLSAECHFALGGKAQAEQFLEQARSMDRNARSVLRMSARVLLDAGKPDAAESFLKQVLDQDPHDTESRYQLALNYRDRGLSDDYAREIALFEESRKLHVRYAELSHQARERPSDWEVRDELADVAQQLGKNEIAALWKRAANAFHQLPSVPQ